MQKFTGILILSLIILFTCSCKQIAYSPDDPTANSLGIIPHKNADYKDPVIFTTEVDYYEPVFNY